jgi:hypothetical protein
VLVNWTVRGAAPEVGLPLKPAEGCRGTQAGITGEEFTGAVIFITKVSDLHRSHCVPAMKFSKKSPELV